MPREIRATDINLLSNLDKYYLEKAIEAASERFNTKNECTFSQESVGRRNCSGIRLDEDTAKQRKNKRYVFAAIAIEGRGKREFTGYNSYVKTHPKQKRYSVRAGESPDRCFTHAELHALSRIHRADAIYIARVDRFGNPALARPCAGCREAIKDAGVRRIIYT